MRQTRKRGKVPVEYSGPTVRSDTPRTYPAPSDRSAKNLNIPIEVVTAVRADNPHQHTDTRPVSASTDDRHIARFAPQFPC